MRIHYYENENNGTVVAVARAEEEFPMDIEPEIARMLIRKGYIDKAKIAMPRQQKAFAKVHGEDTYNAETGRQIARDKVLVKYYAKLGEVHDAYRAGVIAYLEDLKGMEKFCKEKVANARERLENEAK